MHRIASFDDIVTGLDALCRIDPRLVRVRAAAGEVPLRLSAPGFASLASTIVSQQVSRASAEAIFGRLAQRLDPLTPDAILRADAAIFRQAGLSHGKQRTLLAAARAIGEGLDLLDLCRLDAEVAIDLLTAVPGVGPWTAQCYLLFAAGHPDVFPAKDVALQTAVGHALGIQPRPRDRELARLAESWTPWRGVAARLFYAYYLGIRGREAAPMETPARDPG